jgi:hypothetical protein
VALKNSVSGILLRVALLVTANVVPGSQILVTLKIDALSSPKHRFL